MIAIYIIGFISAVVLLSEKKLYGIILGLYWVTVAIIDNFVFFGPLNTIIVDISIILLCFTMLSIGINNKRRQKQ